MGLKEAGEGQASAQGHLPPPWRGRSTWIKAAGPAAPGQRARGIPHPTSGYLARSLSPPGEDQPSPSLSLLYFISLIPSKNTTRELLLFNLLDRETKAWTSKGLAEVCMACKTAEGSNSGSLTPAPDLRPSWYVLEQRFPTFWVPFTGGNAYYRLRNTYPPRDIKYIHEPTCVTKQLDSEYLDFTTHSLDMTHWLKSTGEGKHVFECVIVHNDI